MKPKPTPTGYRQPLEGLKVVEFTHMVMGPTVGLVLADLGAQVTKVEPLGGDKTRNLKGSGAGYFPMYNRNKRSISIDLKSEEGLDLAQQLIADADILIENFRPGALDKLRLDYDSIAAKQPRIIYCSLKGFLSGPYENRVALDEVTQMMGGLAYMTGPPGRPLRAGSSVIDVTGGMFGVIGILAALRERDVTGRGCQVTSSLFETTAFLVGQHMAQQVVSGDPPPPMPVRQSAWAIYDIFTLDSGEQVFVGIVSDQLWLRFCSEFACATWAADSGLSTNAGRVAARDSLLPAIEQLFKPLSLEELSARLERAGLPFAPINRPADLFDDPHLLQSGGLVDVCLTDGEHQGKSAALPALPLQFDHDRPGNSLGLPVVGEHSSEVLAELGISEETCQDLLSRGIIGRSDVQRQD